MGWMKTDSKGIISRRRWKGRHPPAFLWTMGSGLNAETGCKNVYAGKVLEWQTKSMEPRRRRRLEMAVPGITLTSSQLTRIGRNQKARSSLSILTNKVAWARCGNEVTHDFRRICSEEDLAEKAQAMEMTLPVKKSQETRYNLDPVSFFVSCFSGRRPDGVAINDSEARRSYIF